MNRLDSSNRDAFTLVQLQVFKISIRFMVLLYLFSGTSSLAQVAVGPKQAATQEQLQKAKTKVDLAERQFGKINQLSRRGSISQTKLNRSKMDLQIARLELSVIKDPSKAADARLKIARLRFEFAKANHERGKRLHTRGNMSTLQYRRSKFQLKDAEVLLRVAKGDYDTSGGKLVLAKSRLDLARIELQLGEKLYQRRSLSEENYQRLVDRVSDYQENLEELKQQLRRSRRAVEGRIGT